MGGMPNLPVIITFLCDYGEVGYNSPIPLVILAQIMLKVKF